MAAANEKQKKRRLRLVFNSTTEPDDRLTIGLSNINPASTATSVHNVVEAIAGLMNMEGRSLDLIESIKHSEITAKD